MRRLISIITAVMMTALILTTSVSAANAADDVLTINGEGKVNVGDTVKFTLYLDETKEDIIGFELRLFYNSEYLKFDKKSLTSEKFDNLFYNPDIDGKIPMNWTDIGNPVSFAAKDVFLSCEFEAIKGGEASIEYFVTEMYGDDMTYLKSYKWTYDLEVNGKKVITDGVPPITSDEETLNERQSSFINYVDGMGEENTPNKDNHESVEGKHHATYNVYENDVIEVTRYEDVANSPAKNPNFWILVIGIPVIAALVIAAIVIVIKNKKKAGKNEKTDSSDEK